MESQEITREAFAQAAEIFDQIVDMKEALRGGHIPLKRKLEIQALINTLDAQRRAILGVE